jgi:hypothetical protein
VDFLHTSGGRTTAASPRIRAQEPGNLLTWSELHRISGRGVIADTGYGVGGKLSSDNELDYAWLDAEHLRARMADGVIAVTHANPGPGWDSQVNRLRAALPFARHCMHVRPSTNISSRSPLRRPRGGAAGVKERRFPTDQSSASQRSALPLPSGTIRKRPSGVMQQEYARTEERLWEHGHVQRGFF